MTWVKARSLPLARPPTERTPTLMSVTRAPVLAVSGAAISIACLVAMAGTALTLGDVGAATAAVTTDTGPPTTVAHPSRRHPGRRRVRLTWLSPSGRAGHDDGHEGHGRLRSLRVQRHLHGHRAHGVPR